MPSALVLLANGAEEMEVVIAVDVMRRGEIEVTVAGVEGGAAVKSSRGVVITPDVPLDDVINVTYDAVVCPGGLPGATTLAASAAVGGVLKAHEAAGKVVAAICAGPMALASHGIGPGKRLTSHPSVRDKFSAYAYSDERVCVDGVMVTSRAPGTAFEFGLMLVELLQGKEKRDAIVPPMLLDL